MDLETRIKIAMLLADTEGVAEESFVRTAIAAKIRKEYHAEVAANNESALTPQGKTQMWAILNRISANGLFK